MFRIETLDDIRRKKQQLYRLVIENDNVIADGGDPLPIIDPEIAELVVAFNKVPLVATTQSCQGHTPLDILARQCWQCDVPPSPTGAYISFCACVELPLSFIYRLSSLARTFYNTVVITYDNVRYTLLWPHRIVDHKAEEQKLIGFLSQLHTPSGIDWDRFLKVIAKSARKHPRWMSGAYEKFGCYCPENMRFVEMLKERGG